MGKKLCLYLLLAGLLTASLTGCGGETAPETETAGTTETVEEAAAETDYLQSLPEKTFDGAVFSMIGPQNNARQTFALEEETGEPINDALVRRDILVEDTYAVDIQTLLVGEPHVTVGNAIMAGDAPYDVVLGTMIQTQKTLALGHQLTDLQTLPYLQPAREWWCAASYDTLMLNEHLYMTTGPITPQYYFAPAVMAYNHTLAGNYGLPDIDQIVLDGGWTLDLFKTYTADTSRDLNGDGVMKLSDDQFAYAYDGGVTANGMFVSCGNSFFGYDENGKITVDLLTDKVLADMERIHAILSNETITMDGFAAMSRYGAVQKCENLEFAAGRALFVGNSIANMMEFYRDMEDDYSIIPCPKADEQQEDYRSYANPWCLGGVGVPMNITDPEKTGYLLEVMAYISYETVRPEQYDGMLKNKMARNERQHLLLDLIFDNIFYDLNQIFDFGGSAVMAQNALISRYDTFASDYARIETKIQAAIDEVLLSLAE